MDDTELNKRTRRFFFDDDGYGTAGTTTTTTLASQGGLLINIDSATGDVAITSNNWIENERYGFAGRVSTTAGSLEFDSAVTRTGRLTLKVSNTDATGTTFASMGTGGGTTGTLTAGFWKYTIPVKASTKYRFRCFVKTNNVAAAAAFIQCSTYNATGTRLTISSSNTLTGTNDWTLCQINFTSDATAAMLTTTYNNSIAGNISDAWFDVNSMTLEEVIEPVANSLVTPSPSLVSFTAVGSTGNIDQSQLTVNDARGVGGDGSTAVITNKLAQQFTPTKSKFAGIIIRKIADIGTFTGTITAKLMNDNTGAIGATTLASLTLSNATYQAIANDTDYTINLPSNLTADGITKYWVTLEASTSDASNYARIRVQSGNSYTGGIFQAFYSAAWNTVAFDLYFKTLYYKPTTNFKASQNNLSVSVSTDEYGFAEGAVTNILTGAYTWGLGASATDLLTGASVYSATAGSGNAAGSQTIINNYGFFNFNSYNWIGTNFTTNTQDLIWKFTTTRPILGDVIVTFRTFERPAGTTTMAYSLDNASYTTMGTIANAANIEAAYSYTITGLVGETDFFIRFRRAGASSKQDIANLAVTTTVNTTSINGVLKNYPTNKDIIKQYATTLSGATTSATYRATKWGFPAIEYSATEYQFLDVDTTATGSTVAFSELGTTYTTVADGASLAISSTSTPNIFVKANITANRIYSSSNDYAASSDKDGSLKQNITYQVVQ